MMREAHVYGIKYEVRCRGTSKNAGLCPELISLIIRSRCVHGWLEINRGVKR
jgi:hypothetical protein